MSDLVPMSETASFDLIMRQAEVLAGSTIIPAAYRRKAPDIVAAGLAGRAYGWDVMTSMRQFHVIEGTASLRPESMLGLVRQAGHSVTVDTNEKGAVAHGKRADTEDTHSAVFTMEDAEAAGLANKKNWKQYQDAMLTWRAVSKLCRVLFPDVVLGAGYVPEELGAEVDATGDIIEIEPVEEDDSMPIAEAKRAVLEAVGNNTEEAKALWQVEFGEEKNISRTAVSSLLDRLSLTV
tara:strand:+ start:479 stop:1186 length:708 start_codon:yes stop_codon:yes gene_type:complete